MSGLSCTAEVVANWDMVRDDQIVEIVYTNYKGETAARRIQPYRVYFGSNEWHPKPQWFLTAFDVGKGNVLRDFALADIRSWTPAPVEVFDPNV